jgi:hypothetical protein
MKGDHPICTLCDLLNVARGGYYHWRSARPTARQSRDAILTMEISAVYRASRGNYGAPRIVAELRCQGVRISRRRCARLMRSQSLRGRKRHRRSPRTTDSKHGRAVADNLLPSPRDADGTRSGLDYRHHVCVDGRRMALRVGDSGRMESARRWLGVPADIANGPCCPSIAQRLTETAAVSWAASSLGPWHPIRRLLLSKDIS